MYNETELSNCIHINTKNFSKSVDISNIKSIILSIKKQRSTNLGGTKQWKNL